jgi:hypothetical protein
MTLLGINESRHNVGATARRPYPPGYRVRRLDPVPPHDEDCLHFDTTGAEDRRHGRDESHDDAPAKRSRRVNIRVSQPRWTPDADGALGRMRERDEQLARILAIREAVRAHEAPIFAGDVEVLMAVPIRRRHASRLDSSAPKDRLSRLEAGTLVALLMEGLPVDDKLGPEIAGAIDQCEAVGLTVRNVHAKDHGGARVMIDPDELRTRRDAVGLGLRELARQAAEFLPESTADGVYAQLQRIEAGKASTLHLGTAWAVSAVLVDAEVEAGGSLVVQGVSATANGGPMSGDGQATGSLVVPSERGKLNEPVSNPLIPKSSASREPMIEGEAANEQASWLQHEELLRAAHEGARWHLAASTGRDDSVHDASGAVV